MVIKFTKSRNMPCHFFYIYVGFRYSPRKVDEEWLEGAHGCAYKREEISKEEAYMAVGPRDASHGTIPYIRNQPVWARKFSREALDRHYDAIAAKKGCTPGVFCPGGFFKY